MAFAIHFFQNRLVGQWFLYTWNFISILYITTAQVGDDVVWDRVLSSSLYTCIYIYIWFLKKDSLTTARTQCRLVMVNGQICKLHLYIYIYIYIYIMLRPDSQPPARFKAGWPVSKPSVQLQSWPAILPRLCCSICGLEPVQPGDFEANC